MIKHFYIIVSLIEGRYELRKFKSLLNLILSSTAVVTLPHVFVYVKEKNTFIMFCKY